MGGTLGMLGWFFSMVSLDLFFGTFWSVFSEKNIRRASFDV